MGCGNHKCEAICHPYACFPCPVTVNVTCFCKAASITVPCGAEKHTKPPKCKMNCPIPPWCHHKERTPHPCHFGPCPPCSQACDVKLPKCQHSCPLECHDKIAPWPQNTKAARRFDPTKVRPVAESDVQCKECEFMVKRQCFGLHAAYEVACRTERLFDCKRECNTPLQCHPGKCPSCSILLKKRCHCPLKTLKVMKCSESHITQT